MANQTITQLPSAGPITGTELIPLVQNGQTVKATVQAINSSPTLTQTFLTVNQEPTLTNSSYLSGSTGIGLVDNGAQNPLQITLNGASGSLEVAGNGIVAKTASNAVTARTLTASGAGLSVANGDGVAGNPTFALTGVAAAVANLGGTGIMSIRNGATVGGVQILGTTNQIAVANGNGNGNPTISIVDNVVLPGSQAMTLPQGSTDDRPVGSQGQFRYNTTTGRLEWYSTDWFTIGFGDGSVQSVSGVAGQTVVTDPTLNPVVGIASNVVLPGTEAMTIPKGPTADQPAGDAGQLRYDTDQDAFFGYAAGSWRQFSTSGGVTEIDTGLGLLGGPITGAGTIEIDTTVVATVNGTQTLTNKSISGSDNTLSNIGNSSLTNSAITINSTPVSLGGSIDITPSSIGAITAVDGTAEQITSSQVGTVVTLAIADSPLLNGPLRVNGTGSTSITPFAQSMGVFEANDNTYQEVYARNLNNGSDASADFIAYNDASDLDSYFIDMGMNSSNFTSVSYPIFTPNSGYLFTGGGYSGQQSDLFIGTSNPASDIIFFTGGVDTANQRAMINGSTGNLLLNTATDTGYTLNVNGTSYLGGAATFGSTVLLNSDPTLGLQAATKQYVDASASTSFVVHPAVRLATTAALPANVYNNGSSGVGATLTGVSIGQLVIDGTNVAVGDRVLIKNESNQAYNGAYTVTVDGSLAVYVLTRATDFDTTGSGEIANNAYFYVTDGATNIGSSWILSQTAPVTVGTTALPFTLFAQPIAYTVNSPLSLVGTTLSLSGVVDATNGGTGTGTVSVGDLLYGSATNTWSKLALGSAYKSLTINASGTQLEWNAVALNQASAVSGQLGAGNGGTGQASYSVGDMLYASGTTALSKLALGTTNYVLTAGASAPQYVAQSTLSVGSATNATNATNAANTAITTSSTNANYYLTFVSATSGNQPQLVNSSLTLNPSTGKITDGIAGGAF